VRTYVVEPQQIFVPSLLQLLQESGCSIVRVQDALVPLDVVRTRPQMLFFDCDVADDATMRDLQFVVNSMPALDLCFYSRTPPAELQTQAPRRLLYLEKSASHETLLGALGRFTVNA
jgi:hypothetical protein